MAKKKATKKASTARRTSGAQATQPRKRKASGRKPAAQRQSYADGPRYCGLPPMPPREFGTGVSADRQRAIITSSNKWVSGTQLHYYFFSGAQYGREVILTNGQRVWKPWTGSAAEEQAVRDAFEAWKLVGIGLDFIEVQSPAEAEIRIGFESGDGAWSYLGRDVLTIAQDRRTMNFGWNVAQDPDTAIHEIGHTLAMNHEHQNPFSGIVWNEEAVYADLGAPPNNWSRETTHHNILRKLLPTQVEGSEWDPNSIMHYGFRAGLIKEPAQYKTGLNPAPGLSPRDRTWVQSWYPPIERSLPTLRAFESARIHLGPGDQIDFELAVESTRDYTIGTFGLSDSVMVLFEDIDGELRFVDGDDDSGFDRNARMGARLFQGRRYVLRVRLYWSNMQGSTAVMYW